jgi:hypothetical protein
MPHGPWHCAGPRWTHGGAEARAHRSSASRLIPGTRTHHDHREMERGWRRSSPIALMAEAVTEKHGSRAWSSVSWRLRSGRVKLGWGVSAMRHGEGVGTFYRASDGAERAEGRTTGGGSVELQWRIHFGWGIK